MGSAAALPCLLLCILHLTAGASAKPHYLVLFPSVLHYPYTGKVHIHLLDLDGPVRVTLHLASSHRIPNVTLEQQGSGLLLLNWPRFSNVSNPPAETREVARLHISIQGGSLRVSKQKLVLVKALELGTLVQTDKVVYRPGQTVRFRIVLLDHNFIPSNRELPLVAVQDPSGNRIAQWQNVSSQQGIVDLSLPLAAEPALGWYSIEVEGKRHPFSVKEYELPPFVVSIRLPQIVTEKDEKIPLGVCGRYLSGKPFRGRAEGKLCQRRRYGILLDGSPGMCVAFRGQTGRDGCFSTEVLTASFNPRDLEYMSWLEASASLQEEGTGMQRTTTRRCMITDETAPITFENNNWFYQPGTPFTGTVLLKKTKGLSLKEGKFLLVVNASGEIQRKTLLMDRWGRASFQLDTSGWNREVTLRVELKDEPPASERKGNQYPNYSSVIGYLYPLSLGSQNFLQIRRVQRKLPCGQPHTLWVDYLFDGRATAMDVVFLVLAKGTITTVLRKELAAEAGLRGTFSLELPIGPELVPTAKVLGYVVLPNSEMVADSIKIKMAKCFPNKVSLSFSQQRVPAGARLGLQLQAAPGSLCAVYATDQRLQPSGPQGRITTDMVYRSLPVFSGGSYPSEVEEHDCKWSGIHGIIQAPPLNCYDQPRANWGSCRRGRWKRDISMSITSFQPYSLLKDVGLKIATDIELYCGSDIQGAEWEVGVMQDTGKQIDFLGAWLWDLVPVGAGGSAEVAVTVPNAITEWEAGMFCTSPLGLGLAPATTLRAFKPFFVELALPYAVVRREAFSLLATVFNYLRQCLRVRVTLVESEELEVLGLRGEQRGACVCADQERSFRWDVRATSLGEVNVTVIAEAVQSQELCGTQVPVIPAQGHVDTETKLLMVQPPKQM